jgi:signal transduction histidine kinase
VKDTGIGIKQEDFGTIFNRFKKSGNAIGVGYGLGLSIVKSIIQFHGFDIQVKSNFGINTEFSIIIPSEMINMQ